MISQSLRFLNEIGGGFVVRRSTVGGVYGLKIREAEAKTRNAIQRCGAVSKTTVHPFFFVLKFVIQFLIC